MKYIKQICSVLLAFCLLPVASVTVYAHEVPDETRKGTVTVEMEYDGEAVAGGTLTAYRVGQIQESDGNYAFAKTDAMAAFTGSYAEITSADLAESIAAFVKENQIAAYATAQNQNGKAVFSDLELGLYLIVQTEAAEGYAEASPFLVSVPMERNGGYVYDVDASPKVELEREPETDPDTPTSSEESTPEEGSPTEPSGENPPGSPDNPELPYTGQLWWPVPLLAVVGLIAFVLGWLLRRGERHD